MEATHIASLDGGLRALRERIRASAVPRSRPGHLKIATWNVREFGRRPRRARSIAYIAEIVSQFHVVSIVELREDLTQLRAVLAQLGPSWRAVFTAPTFDAGGNRERAAYVFDTRHVTHSGLASMAFAPRTKRGEEYLSQIGWWRPPFFASFTVGRTELLLLTAHVRWGKNAPARLIELELLADWVHAELAKDPYARGRALVVLGDFNVPRLESPLYAALTKRGLEMPAALAGKHGSNLARNKRYDQILAAPGTGGMFTGAGGALDFYSGHGGIGALYPSRVDKREFTYELSDHLPLWAELACDVDPARTSVIT